MKTICISIAMICFALAIASGLLLNNNSWKSVGITWGLLAVGIVFFGLALTL